MREKTPYPYCPHGKYVGGCGIDWMCHECEMGYEDSSPAELQAFLDRHHWAIYVECVDVGRFQGLGCGAEFVYGLVMEKHGRRLRMLQAELEFASWWALDPLDSDWRSRHYETMVREWNEELTADDQFYDLPAHILDGA